VVFDDGGDRNASLMNAWTGEYRSGYWFATVSKVRGEIGGCVIGTLATSGLVVFDIRKRSLTSSMVRVFSFEAKLSPKFAVQMACVEWVRRTMYDDVAHCLDKLCTRYRLPNRLLWSEPRVWRSDNVHRQNARRTFQWSGNALDRLRSSRQCKSS
jgi:hypothetical protein